jgi:hypothetical protein
VGGRRDIAAMYRVSQKDVYTRLIFRIIMCIHLFGILCICSFHEHHAVIMWDVLKVGKNI